MSEEGFFSRWARRKNEVRTGQAPEESPAKAVPAAEASPATPAVPTRPSAPPAAGAVPREGETPPPAAAPAAEAEPLPSMADVSRLTPDSDYSGFMRQGVDEDVRRAAMKKLFTDPHYNVMDRLDIYIDDYSKPDPIPPSMLRKMVQSQMLGLFKDEEAEKEKAAAVADATPIVAPTHDGGAAAVPQSRAEEPPLAAPAADVAAAAPDTRVGGALPEAASPAEGGGEPLDSRMTDPAAPDRAAGRS